MHSVIDLRRLPGQRPFAVAYANDFASVASLFPGDPRDPGAWRDAIGRVAAAPGDRRGMTDVVSRQLERRGAPDEARRSAARLADPTSVAIVTGQQAGLFGGPLYTLLKAATAVRLARDIERDHHIPAVPVFWVEAEDHDWEEVRQAWFLDAEDALRAVALAPSAGAGTQSVGALRIGDDVTATFEALVAVLPSTEFTNDVLDLLRRCYRPGAGVGAAFAALLDALLGQHGLVVYESDDVAAKPLVQSVFARALECSSRTTSLVREACADMRRLGHEPPVEPADDAVALFHLSGAGRRAIKRDGDGFRAGDERWTKAALLAEAASHPDHFSPNVLLRPIVQDRLFPTVAYVGGPAEIAYQAELGGVYRAFGVAAPLLVPRLTATILDAGARRFLDRSHMPFESLQPQDDGALNALLAAHFPPQIDEAIDAARSVVAARFADVKASVPAVDPTLAGAVDTTVARIEETIKQLRSKILQAGKRKNETLRRQFMRTRALAFPGGDPQERVLSVAFFLNRYGLSLGGALLDVQADVGTHVVVSY